jgi:RHS repeat-associated protein
MTDSGSAGILPAIYTAFGERVCPGGDCTGVANHRYGYAGAYGYQTHDDLPFLHVGHRYYDPATGRFLQRDPIGIRGGLLVYDYATDRPSANVDPTGLIPDNLPPSMWPPDAHKTHEEREAERKVATKALKLSCYVAIGGWAGGLGWAIAGGMYFLVDEVF